SDFLADQRMAITRGVTVRELEHELEQRLALNANAFAEAVEAARFGPPAGARAAAAAARRELSALKRRLRRRLFVLDRLRGFVSLRSLGGDGTAFGVEVRDVHQPSVLGSADAVARAVEAGAPMPLLVCAADTVFRQGDVASFVRAFEATGAAGAIAVRRDPPPGPG